MLKRDAAILTARNSITSKLPGIKPLGDRARRDVADLRHLPGGKHLPILLLGPMVACLGQGSRGIFSARIVLVFAALRIHNGYVG
jgi:hypothetical protein